MYLFIPSLDLSRHAAVDCLLAVMKLLLNLTHDSELGSHRVGGQKGAMEAILSTIFQVHPFLARSPCNKQSVVGRGVKFDSFVLP